MANHAVLPHDNEAERCLLGSMMLNPDVIGEVAEDLQPSDFYEPLHTEVFATIVLLYIEGKVVDAVTVADNLKKSKSLERNGGKVYLHGLLECVPTAAHAAEYAKIVVKESTRRALVKASHEINVLGYETVSDVEDAVDKAGGLIFDIAHRRASRQMRSAKDAVDIAYKQLCQLYETKQMPGIRSGFPDLDDLLTGFYPGDLIILAGRPSVGKTALALNIGQNVAEAGIPVLLYSLEMSTMQLMNRLICSEARVDSHRVRTGRLSVADWTKITNAVGRMEKLDLNINDTSDISVLGVRTSARRRLLREPQGLVIIDYLQLMQAFGRHDNRVQEVTEISRGLKILAKELSVPVIALSQLSRAIETRPDKKPVLSDLRESGSLEQDADVVLFLHQPDKTKNVIDVCVAKHRNGPLGKVPLTFFSRYTRFTNHRPDD